MVLAAGEGLRLRPVTEVIPKPLLPVVGRTLLERLLASLQTVGVTDAVVGTGWKHEQVADHITSLDLDVTTHAVRVPDYRIGPLATFVRATQQQTFASALVCPADYVSDVNTLDTLVTESPCIEDCPVAVVAVSRHAGGSVVFGTDDGRLCGIRHDVTGSASPVGFSAMSMIVSSRFVESCGPALGNGLTHLWQVVNMMVEQGREVRYVYVGNPGIDVDDFRGLLDAVRHILLNPGPDVAGGLYVPEGDSMEFRTALSSPSRTVIEAGVEIVGPAYVGPGSHIGTSCRVGPFVSIERDSVMGDQVEARDVVFLPGSIVSPSSTLANVVVHFQGQVHLGD
ncbi:MAG: NTP transferase domain-containing protein [Candidatus Thorarchaeota archaeon]